MGGSLCRKVSWVALALVLCGSACAQPDLNPDVLQGGFQLMAPEADLRQEIVVLSLGPILVAGGLARAIVTEGEQHLCTDVVFVLLGAEKAKRSDDSIKLKQKDKVLVSFVFSQCDETGVVACIERRSESAPITGCRGDIKVDAGGGLEGKGKIKCRDGVNVSAEEFGLSPEEEARIAAAFPNLASEFAVKVGDENGRPISEASLEDALEDLGLEDFDDLIDALLYDDDLADCEV